MRTLRWWNVFRWGRPGRSVVQRVDWTVPKSLINPLFKCCRECWQNRCPHSREQATYLVYLGKWQQVLSAAFLSPQSHSPALGNVLILIHADLNILCGHQETVWASVRFWWNDNTIPSPRGEILDFLIQLLQPEGGKVIYIHACTYMWIYRYRWYRYWTEKGNHEGTEVLGEWLRHLLPVLHSSWFNVIFLASPPTI